MSNDNVQNLAVTINPEFLNTMQGVQNLVTAAQEFCTRVEAGEIRSVQSYNRFKEALILVNDGVQTKKSSYYHLNGMSAHFDIDPDLGQLILACDRALEFVINGPGVLASQEVINEQFQRRVVELVPRVKAIIENRITVKYPYAKLVEMTFEKRNGLAERPKGYKPAERLRSSIDQIHKPACALSVHVNTLPEHTNPDAALILDQLATMTEHMQQIMILFGFTRDDIELASRQRMDSMLP